MNIKRILAVVLALCFVVSIPVFSAQAEESSAAVPSFVQGEGLYAHAGTNSADTEAWMLWQNAEDEDGIVLDSTKLYFFLPSGCDDEKIDIYNGFEKDVNIDSLTLTKKAVISFDYETNKEYDVKIGSEDITLKLEFKKSTAEAAIFANNPNADGQGTALYDYIKNDKSLSATATGAIVDSSGAIDNTAIKKIKGRGNTTWSKPKKPFNITFSSAVSIAGMDKGKKFSLLANYQDASLARNRILYDLADAVKIPYASDSRFVDFYMNGVYYGSYQCAQKIEVGKSDLINDIPDKDYVTSDGKLADNFSFCIEIDPSFGEDDYHTSQNSNEITIKSPELTAEQPLYNDVKNKIKSKFAALFSKLGSTNAKSMAELIDIDSFTKMFLINELGKNWDSGVSSFYMVYKQSPDGKWRFYASPVWDYDNSLGNCVGIERDLNNMGVSDYTEYTGWWCKFKGKRQRDTTSSNILNNCANNSVIQERASQLWIEVFMPKIKRFAADYITEGELYSASRYLELLRGTADMNYTRGWFVNTGAWISDHSSLIKAEYKDGTYSTASAATNYTDDFEGEYNYMIDWLTSRAAWLTNEFYKTYKPSRGDVNGDLKININDATEIQLALAGKASPKYHEKSADYNGDGDININDVTDIQIDLARK